MSEQTLLPQIASYWLEALSWNRLVLLRLHWHRLRPEVLLRMRQSELLVEISRLKQLSH